MTTSAKVDILELYLVHNLFDFFGFFFNFDSFDLLGHFFDWFCAFKPLQVTQREGNEHIGQHDMPQKVILQLRYNS